MVSDLIDLGARLTTAREAGNILEMLTEELPGTMKYAEFHAERDGRDAVAIVSQFGEMLETAKTTLGDDVYQDMAMSHRRPPQPR